MCSALTSGFEISETTNKLLEKMRVRKGTISGIQNSPFSVGFRKRLKEDLHAFNRRKQVTAAKKKQSLKKCRSELYYHTVVLNRYERTM